MIKTLLFIVHQELERVDLSSYSREGCNELLRKWFGLKEDSSTDDNKEDEKKEL